VNQPSFTKMVLYAFMIETPPVPVNSARPIVVGAVEMPVASCWRT
jgi:hypothetical protein